MRSGREVSPRVRGPEHQQLDENAGRGGGNPHRKKKKKIVSSCLPSSPLRYFRSVPDAERASLRTKEPSADKHRVGLPCVSRQSP